MIDEKELLRRLDGYKMYVTWDLHLSYMCEPIDGCIDIVKRLAKEQDDGIENYYNDLIKNNTL